MGDREGIPKLKNYQKIQSRNSPLILLHHLLNQALIKKGLDIAQTFFTYQTY